jgi:glycosyltransferase involved in cell wall biosynthesis
VTRYFAALVARRLSRLDCDLVISPDTLPVAHLRCRQPIVFWNDATFAGMVGYNPSFSNLTPRSIRTGNAVNQAALDRCVLAVYSSEWAAETARTAYSVWPAKVHVVPFGANLTSGMSPAQAKGAVSSRPESMCRLLFIGVDWRRKGADIAVAVAGELNAAGLATELHVVGTGPPEGRTMPAYVSLEGYIDTSTPGGRRRLSELLVKSHFLIVPTRTECFGIVFAEAASFAVPSLATRTGGTPSAVADGVSGKLFSLQAGSREYRDYVLHHFADRAAYERLALSAFSHYETRLNWDVAAQDLLELARTTIGTNESWRS